MRVPLILLFISLLTAGLYSQAIQPIVAQRPNTVTISSRGIASQPGIPEVRAVADRTRVPVGDQVTFTLSPATVIRDSRYRVTLFFGDGSRQIMLQTQAIHRYQTSGTYTYSILVEPAKRVTPTPTPVPVIPEVRLRINPALVDVNQAVSFSAELDRPVRGLSYRFVFDDGSATGWQSEAVATHAYRAPKTYQPYVDLGLSLNGVMTQVGGSRRQTITVSRNQIGNQNANTNGNQNTNPSNDNGNGNANSNTRPNENQSNAGNRNTSGNLNANSNANARGNGNGNLNANPNPPASATVSTSPIASTNESPEDWWKYLVFLPLLLLAGYKAATYFLVPRPTFVPHSDVGKAKASGFAFDFQVDVDPNVDGTFKVDAAGESLIKAKRMSDD